MINKTSDLNLVFPTPIWTKVIDNFSEINSKMNKYIQDLQLQNPKGKIKSNMLGWHSENFNLQDSEVKFFLESISININKAINDMGWDLEKNIINITSMWSIINKKDASNARHTHSNNYISAAYYVEAPENCGDIIFYDPRDERIVRKPVIKNLNDLNSEVINITPKNGMLVLFPSYLHHSVDFNKSDKNRIVISFNIDMIPKNN